MRATRPSAGSEQVLGQPGRSTSRIRILAAAVFLALLVAGLPYFHFRKPPRPTDKDVIVIADFSNTTGDPVFDSTLKEALATLW